MGNQQQPVFADIAGGNVDSTGTSNGDKLQGTQGCIASKSGTGLILIQLSAPNDGLAEADIVVLHNPGMGTSKSGGGLTTTLSGYAAGAFTIEVWDQTTVPPALLDGSVSFVVKRKYRGT